ncbi:MAG: trimeric intracellular cation channel family protein [Victivallales bacterium]|nr:trimeric intracellular cation channel family protein [Victivallales bacterium]
MSENVIFFADLLGTVIFAITGAVSGMRLKLDLLGVIVFGCIVGVGGGIVRDTVIGATPVAVLQNEVYLASCIVTGLLVFFLFKRLENHKRVILICDAFGLGVFTALGVAKGNLHGLGPIGMVLCGVMSAVGGGLLRDIMARRIPEVLVNNFYATASLLGGLAYIILQKLIKTGSIKLSDFSCFLITTLLVLVIRLLAIRYNFHLPGARVEDIGDSDAYSNA